MPIEEDTCERGRKHRVVDHNQDLIDGDKVLSPRTIFGIIQIDIRDDLQTWFFAYIKHEVDHAASQVGYGNHDLKQNPHFKDLLLFCFVLSCVNFFIVDPPATEIRNLYNDEKHQDWKRRDNKSAKENFCVSGNC